MNNNLILVGSPNTGKTTLFNTMTGSNRKASNWHGVTVDVVTKQYVYDGQTFNIADIPGIYSLDGLSGEELIASNYIKDHKDDLIINICDANNFKRNFILTLELLKKNYDVMIVINMCSEVKAYDYEKLSKKFNLKIIEIDARKKRSVDELKKYINNYIKNKKPQNILKSSEIDIKNANLSIIFKDLKISNINPYKNTERLDKIILNKFLFVPIFLSCLFLMFFVTFGPAGSLLLNLIEFISSKIIALISKFFGSIKIASGVTAFLVDGVIGSLFSVLSFVPQIALLMFFLNLLEDTGLMSRVAFMFDGVLKRVGLSGKSLFSLMMGFGCTTSAVMTTRNLQTERLRKRTALLLPFMSCSAKLPIFLVISSLFFEKYKFVFVFLLYIFGIMISLFFAIIYNKFLPEKNVVSILEMPKYRMPNLKKICKDTGSVVKEFLIKVGTLILIFTSLLWFLQNFSTKFEYLAGENFSNSILYFVSNKLTPIFGVIGLGSAGIVSAILLGLVAKEMIVVGLCMINGISGSILLLSESLVSGGSICSFTPITSVIFLIFILLYAPCISALAAIKNEFGIKTALYVFVAQFGISFAVSFLIYRIILNPNLIYFVILAILLDVAVHFVIKFSRNKKTCWRGCYDCKARCGKKRTKVISTNS